MPIKRFKQLISRLNNFFPLRLLLLIITLLLTLIAITFPIAIRPYTYYLKLGDVSPQEIRAPYNLSFESSFLSNRARDDAANAIQPIFLPADRGISRHQLDRLRASLDFINHVRADIYAEKNEKLNDLAALSDAQLSQDTSILLLSIDETQWQNVQQESLSILEQVMRNTIREDRLRDAQKNIPSLISFSLSPEEASIVTELVTAFAVANSLYSEDLTQQARTEAKSKIAPITRNIIEGETIVMRGQIINEPMIEALKAYNLLQPKISLKDVLGAVSLLLLAGFFIFFFYRAHKIIPSNDFRSLVLISISFLVFLFGARVSIPNRTIVPYLFPLSAFGLTISFIFAADIGIVFSVLIGIISAYNLPNSLDLTLFYIITGICGILALGRGRRISNFFWAGMAIGASGSAVILSYRLISETTDWFGVATLLGASFFNGLASSSLALILQFLLAQLLDLTTPFRLLELSRSENPLLNMLLRNAPGTYQHSLQVANLAEQAAEQIGADALLTRVGALYHDIGKAVNPLYFIENQTTGAGNPHDLIDPESSASIILSHIANGIELANKNRLPPRIQDFIWEHHGTLLTRYQFTRAMQKVNGNFDVVDKERFRYPGPRPRSKETVLLMLADGCEAKARAEHPSTREDIEVVIDKVFKYLQQEGQLDDTQMSFKDLEVVRRSFVSTLMNTHHPRIMYPEFKPPEQEEIHEGN